MAEERRRLGRGLAALLGEAGTEAPVARFTPFAVESAGETIALDCGARQGRTFVAERTAAEATENETPVANVFDAVIAHIKAAREAKKRVLIAAWSEGARERLQTVLGDHGLKGGQYIATLAQASAMRGDEIAFAVWGIERGFETDQLTVIGEQDILGDRLVRRAKKSRRAQDVIAEAASLNPGAMM